jgi:hypothetical protein
MSSRPPAGLAVFESTALPYAMGRRRSDDCVAVLRPAGRASARFRSRAFFSLSQGRQHGRIENAFIPAIESDQALAGSESRSNPWHSNVLWIGYAKSINRYSNSG